MAFPLYLPLWNGVEVLVESEVGDISQYGVAFGENNTWTLAFLLIL